MAEDLTNKFHLTRKRRNQKIFKKAFIDKLFLSRSVLLKRLMVLRCRMLLEFIQDSDAMRPCHYPCQTGLSIFPSVARHLIKTGCANSCLFYGLLHRASTG